MLRRLRASMMLTVIFVLAFSAIDMLIDTSLGEHIYSLPGMLLIFGVAFVMAPIVLRKIPLR